MKAGYPSPVLHGLGSLNDHHSVGPLVRHLGDFASGPSITLHTPLEAHLSHLPKCLLQLSPVCRKAIAIGLLTGPRTPSDVVSFPEHTSNNALTLPASPFQ